jgi:hypothetical protein
MLIDEIQNELTSTFSHIKGQESTLKEALESFKRLVFKE